MYGRIHTYMYITTYQHMTNPHWRHIYSLSGSRFDERPTCIRQVWATVQVYLRHIDFRWKGVSSFATIYVARPNIHRRAKNQSGIVSERARVQRHTSVFWIVSKSHNRET